MTASTPHSRNTLLFSAIALLALVASASIIGCKRGQPSAVSQEQPVTTTNPVVNPFVTRKIYSETANPNADIAAALKKARAEHKRVLLDFGGDWCGDCQVLDIYFHQGPNAALLAKYFVLVPVYIGQMDRNLDIAQKYGVPINKGVPALAVLDADGKLLYAQQTGQFENMRNMSVSSVTDFLNRWKA